MLSCGSAATNCRSTDSYQTNETYTYDANGNRTLTGYQTGANNQLLNDGTHTYEYDGEGNRTAKETIATGERVEYTWDHHNRLTGVTYRDGTGTVTKTAAYTYDAWDRRIRKEVDDNGDGSIDRSETFLYDEAHPSLPAGGNLTDIVLRYEDSDGAGPSPVAQASRYLHGPAVDQIFADEQASGELYWLLTDHQGTVRDLATSDPGMMQTTVANHRTFDSFGNITSETDPAVTTLYGYTSRETDPDADLTYYRARWYDAVIGQFLSEDPLGFAANDANVRRYVGNSTTFAIDPSGLAEWVWPWDPDASWNPIDTADTWAQMTLDGVYAGEINASPEVSAAAMGAAANTYSDPTLTTGQLVSGDIYGNEIWGDPGISINGTFGTGSPYGVGADGGGGVEAIYIPETAEIAFYYYYGAGPSVTSPGPFGTVGVNLQSTYNISEPDDYTGTFYNGTVGANMPSGFGSSAGVSVTGEGFQGPTTYYGGGTWGSPGPGFTTQWQEYYLFGTMEVPWVEPTENWSPFQIFD